MSETFVTTFQNLRRKARVVVFELNGQPLVSLDPGQTLQVESLSKETTYARWTSIIFTDNSDLPVQFKARPNWTEPDHGKWKISILNQHGRNPEPLLVNGEQVFIPQNVPVTIGLMLDSPLLKYSRLHCHEVLRRRKVRDWPGIFMNNWELVWEALPRPQAELDEAIRILDAKIKAAEAKEA